MTDSIIPASTFHLCAARLASPIVSAIYGNKIKWYIWIFIDLLDLLLFNSSAINSQRCARRRSEEIFCWTLDGLPRSTMGAMCGLPSTPLDKSRQSSFGGTISPEKSSFLPFSAFLNWAEIYWEIGVLLCKRKEKKQNLLLRRKRESTEEKKYNLVAVFWSTENFHFFPSLKKSIIRFYY